MCIFICICLLYRRPPSDGNRQYNGSHRSVESRGEAPTESDEGVS